MKNSFKWAFGHILGIGAGLVVVSELFRLYNSHISKSEDKAEEKTETKTEEN